MLKQIVFVFLVTFVISLVHTEVVEWEPCDAQLHCQIKQVRMSPCSAAPDPCKFKRGTTAGMEFDFIPDFQGTAGNLKGEIFWVTGGSEVPFAGMNTDGCAFTNCPLVINEQQTYNYSIVTSRSYPLRTFTIKMRLTGDDNKECCFNTKIKLVR